MEGRSMNMKLQRKDVNVRMIAEGWRVFCSGTCACRKTVPSCDANQGRAGIDRDVPLAWPFFAVCDSPATPPTFDLSI